MVTIRTLDQRELVNFRADESNLTIRFGGSVTIARIAREDIASLRPQPSGQARVTLRPETIQGGDRFVDEIFATREYALFPELSYALGLAGATGNRYRPSLALHSLGMTAAGLLGRTRQALVFRITGIIDRGFVRNIIISEAFLRDLLQADVGQVLKQAPTMKAYHNVPSPANPTRIASMIASGCAARIAIAGHGFAVIVVTTTFVPITTRCLVSAKESSILQLVWHQSELSGGLSSVVTVEYFSSKITRWCA